jgi:hypothetical protein
MRQKFANYVQVNVSHVSHYPLAIHVLHNTLLQYLAQESVVILLIIVINVFLLRIAAAHHVKSEDIKMEVSVPFAQ